MALKYRALLRSARALQLETDLGASPILRIKSGSPPATPEDTPTGVVLAEMTLPVDAFTENGSGVLSMQGSWTTNAALAGGTAAHFSLDKSDDTPVVVGTVAQSGADMDIDNTSIAVGQEVTVNTFAITEGNA